MTQVEDNQKITQNIPFYLNTSVCNVLRCMKKIFNSRPPLHLFWIISNAIWMSFYNKCVSLNNSFMI